MALFKHVVAPDENGDLVGRDVAMSPEEEAAHVAAAAEWEEAQPALLARAERDRRLALSDVRVLPDRWAALSPELQGAWAAYRQALRDLPGQAGFPVAIEWPAEPVAS